MLRERLYYPRFIYDEIRISNIRKLPTNFVNSLYYEKCSRDFKLKNFSNANNINLRSSDVKKDNCHVFLKIQTIKDDYKNCRNQPNWIITALFKISNLDSMDVDKYKSEYESCFWLELNFYENKLRRRYAASFKSNLCSWVNAFKITLIILLFRWQINKLLIKPNSKNSEWITM